MDLAYYQDYYKLERTHWWFVIRGQLIQRLTKQYAAKNQPLRILNVGVATGRTTELLSALGEVTSVEYESSCCTFLREELAMEVTEGSVTDLPYQDGSYDVVCAFDVIEHVEDHQTAVAELQRVCNPNGLVFVTVPAHMLLWSHHDIVNQHFRRYTRSELTGLFSEQIGKIVYSSYFNALLAGPVLMLRWMTRLVPKNWVRSKAGSDFTILADDSLLNKLFYKVLAAEVKLMPRVSLPTGTSAFCLWQKGAAALN
ncbi:class I SAM-dependent methyltransferase [Fibrella aquatilis]|uniref:Class I SAM-dependent methyltransferase n=1 Tax=Fibrella aquatilis TaxID=2817059 RepID=A0A939JYL1_9BACT|nr:class I SAM-dependent methyltransferase [Fibrella aquatilis]MBO0930488.1 class I SAM-dependent methyltransferase [Fibrella aquatilis]